MAQEKYLYQDQELRSLRFGNRRRHQQPRTGIDPRQGNRAPASSMDQEGRRKSLIRSGAIPTLWAGCRKKGQSIQARRRTGAKESAESDWDRRASARIQYGCHNKEADVASVARYNSDSLPLSIAKGSRTTILSQLILPNSAAAIPHPTDKNTMVKLTQALRAVHKKLFDFAQAGDFIDNWKKVFGTSYDISKTVDLQVQWRRQDFSQLPPIKLIAGDGLKEANGAYAISTNQIYLSKSSLNTFSLESVVTIILEEIGHSVDTQINQHDTPGDEGEHFAALAQKLNLSAQELKRINRENDFGIITIQGQKIIVERSELIILVVNTTVDQNDGIIANGLSLRDAILIANANTTNDYIIELKGGLTYFLTQNNSQPLLLGDENAAETGDLDILPGGRVTIKSTGSGLAIIDGSKVLSPFRVGDRVLHVLSGGNLTLDNITVTKAKLGGIWIDEGGLANINNSKITENTSDRFIGGNLCLGAGIINFGTLNLSSSTVSRNATDRDAGGIGNFGIASLSNSVIDGNSAANNGAGIYNEGKLTISETTISNNRIANDISSYGVTGKGGGIYNSESGSIIINKSLVRKNFSEFDGGGISNQGNIAFNNSTISNNISNYTGGGIFVDSGMVSLNSSQILNNKADNDHSGGGIGINHGSLIIDKSVIKGNTATSYGGGISYGYLYNDKLMVTISDSTISENSAVSGGGIEGGGKLSSAELNITNSIITRNRAMTSGGGLYVYGITALNNTTVSNNISAGEGGGIVNQGPKGRLTLHDSVVEGNKANGGVGGGISTAAASNSVIKNSVIRNNWASDDGGGISFFGGFNDVVNSTISNNTSGGLGGGISSNGYNSITNSTISSNQAKTGGGFAGRGIFQYPAYTNLQNTTISGNKAIDNGGGLYTASADTSSNLCNVTLTNNTADSDNNGQGNGGGAYSDGIFSLYNSIMAGNFDTPNNKGKGTIYADFAGYISSNSNNLLGNNLTGAIPGSIIPGTNNIINSNIRLGVLKNNGGSTQTHALLPGSPAIDAGYNDLLPLDTVDLDNDGKTTEKIPFDQRGISFSRIIGETIDIGAFEEQQPLPIVDLTVLPQSVSEDSAKKLVYTFTLNRALNNPLTINYLIGGTASLNLDYTQTGAASFGAKTGTVIFPANALSSTIIIAPTNDQTVERNETIALTLAAGQGYKIGSKEAGTSTILNDDIASPSTYTLNDSESSLLLIGTAAINGTGNDLNNIITGNSNSNRLEGLLGADTLTGMGSKDQDIFVYNSRNDSLLGSGNLFDTITDFNSNDRIAAPANVNKAKLVTPSGIAGRLSEASIANVLTASTFTANSVAAFSTAGFAGTFIAMNDNRSGFQANRDSIIFLKEYVISNTNFVDFI